MECLSFCVADCIDLARLDHHFKSVLVGYTSTRSRDVLKIAPSNTVDVLVFVFKNGTAVTWGLKRHQTQAYIDSILLFANKPASVRAHDEFTYCIGAVTAIEPHEYFDVDCLTIEENSAHNAELKLSLSYGFSQSVKLQYFETIIETLIEKNMPHIQNLSKKGKKSINSSQIKSVIGEIILAKSEMNLISNFFYHPKYFWQHPTLEKDYIMLEHYLHIQRRVKAINHRLDTLNEIFDMFHQYLVNHHAHILELIIVALIAIEIIFGVLNLHF
jgi:uncharacterized Rmd1/YagE family protein